MYEIAKLSFNALAPTFLIIAFGYLCKRVGIITEEQQPINNKLAFRTFLPLYLFYNIYSSDVDFSSSMELTGFCLLGLILSFAIAVVFTMFYQKNPERQGVMIQALYRSNYVLLGIPIATALYPEVLGQASLISAFFVPASNTLAVIALDSLRNKQQKWHDTVLDIIKNPLIIASFLGIVFLIWGIKLPIALDNSIKKMASIATPFLLFLLGVSLNFHSLFDRDLIVCMIGRLIVIPGIMMLTASLFGWRKGDFAIVLAVFASPQPTSAFTMVQQLGGDSELACNVVVLSSVLSFFTILFWISLFMQFAVI